MLVTEYTDPWIEALESGDYKQVTGALHGPPPNKPGDEWGYCCLGVGAKVCNELRIDSTDGGYVVQDPDAEYEDEDDARYNRSFSELNERQLQMLGLTIYESSSLITANDEEGYTFPQIAAKLREAKETGKLTFPWQKSHVDGA